MSPKMSPTRRIAAIGVTAMLAAVPVAARSQDKVASFYKDKTISVYIGADVGGGFTAYARTVWLHAGQYIPGSPKIVLLNMPGAGSRKATAYVAAVAAKDGTAIGAPYPGAIVEPVFGDPKNVRYKPLAFGYIGSVDSSDYLCLSRKDSKVQKFSDAFQNELVIGGDAKGFNLFYIANVLKNVLGAKFKIVNGYKGSHDIVMAMERGEVHGMCGYGWAALISQAGYLVQQHKVNLLVQFAKKGEPEPTKLGAPMVWDFVKTPEQRELLELVAAPQVFGRPYFLPAEAPRDRLTALRRAFDKVMKDPGFLADARKQKLSVTPATGEEVEASVKQIFTASPATLAKVRAAMND